MHRRDLLVAGAALPLSSHAGDNGFQAGVAAGGVVVAFRHALAPGIYDPPGFRLGECSTQRNLDDEGRGQARRIGAWFERRRLQPAAVRSSPWCRCMDTARLAFGRAQAWHALGSPRAGAEEVNNRALAELGAALKAATAQPGRFEVWVTHQFVLSAWLGTTAASAEALLLRAQPSGQPQVLARLAVP